MLFRFIRIEILLYSGILDICGFCDIFFYMEFFFGFYGCLSEDGVRFSFGL